MTPAELLALLPDRPLAFAAGETVFADGEAGRALFVVRTGTVTLRRGTRTLEVVEPGGLVGEMALVDPAPRSATAIAGEGCTVIPIDEEGFHALVRQHPRFALEVMRTMARRLRRATAARVKRR